jgi:hypothetical protein
MKKYCYGALMVQQIVCKYVHKYREVANGDWADTNSLHKFDVLIYVHSRRRLVI